MLPEEQNTTTDLVPETASERTLDYRDTAGHRTALTLTEDARTLFREGLAAEGEQKLPLHRAAGAGYPDRPSGGGDYPGLLAEHPGGEHQCDAACGGRAVAAGLCRGL